MPKEWDGIVSQYINRKMSRPMAKFLANYPQISPNHVTFSSFLAALASGLAFFLSQPIMGGVLAQFSSILDGVDGDLAILTNRVSLFGGFLDALLDRYGDSIILIGLTYHAFITNGQNMVSMTVGIAALIGSLMVSYSRARAKSDLSIVFNKGFVGYAANRDVRLFIIMLGGILNQIFATLLILATLSNLVVLIRIHHAWNSTRMQQNDYRVG